MPLAASADGQVLLVEGLEKCLTEPSARNVPQPVKLLAMDRKMNILKAAEYGGPIEQPRIISPHGKYFVCRSDDPQGRPTRWATYVVPVSRGADLEIGEVIPLHVGDDGEFVGLVQPGWPREPGVIAQWTIKGEKTELIGDVMVAAVDGDLLYYIQSGQPGVLKAVKLSELKKAASQPASAPAPARSPGSTSPGGASSTSSTAKTSPTTAPTASAQDFSAPASMTPAQNVAAPASTTANSATQPTLPRYAPTSAMPTASLATPATQQAQSIWSVAQPAADPAARSGSTASVTLTRTGEGNSPPNGDFDMFARAKPLRLGDRWPDADGKPGDFAGGLLASPLDDLAVRLI
jgi:hypothetical protein